MIKATITRDAGLIVGFRLEGHSGYAEKGRDIVCAAASAVAQTAVLGLEHTPGISVEKSIREAFLECRVLSAQPGEARVRHDAITQTMLKGLLSLEAGHKDYIKIEICDIEEVSTCS